MWQDERLLATYKDGRAHLNAYLDDYAFLLAAAARDAAGRLPRGRTSRGPRRSATRCSSASRTAAGGGFFFTSHDHERLIHRPKPGHDNATPVGQRRRGAGRSTAWPSCRARRASGRRPRARSPLFWPAIERSPGGLREPARRAGGDARAADDRHRERPAGRASPRGARPCAATTCPDTLVAFRARRDDRACRRRSPSRPAPAVNAWVCEGVTCLRAPRGAGRNCAKRLKAPKIAWFRADSKPFRLRRSPS